MNRAKIWRFALLMITLVSFVCNTGAWSPGAFAASLLSRFSWFTSRFTPITRTELDENFCNLSNNVESAAGGVMNTLGSSVAGLKSSLYALGLRYNNFRNTVDAVIAAERARIAQGNEHVQEARTQTQSNQTKIEHLQSVLGRVRSMQEGIQINNNLLARDTELLEKLRGLSARRHRALTEQIEGRFDGLLEQIEELDKRDARFHMGIAQRLEAMDKQVEGVATTDQEIRKVLTEAELQRNATDTKIAQTSALLLKCQEEQSKRRKLVAKLEARLGRRVGQAHTLTRSPMPCAQDTIQKPWQPNKEISVGCEHTQVDDID